MHPIRVSIFINEGDRWHGAALHLQLLRALEKNGIAGATVVRGVAGYTRADGITTTSLVDVGHKLPLVVEFIDDQGHVERMLPELEEMVGERLITTSEIAIRHGGAFKSN
jgi:PII-like signaling protein